MPGRVHRLDALVLFDRLLAVVQLNLLEDELLVLGDLQTKQFEVEIEVTDGLACWLIILKMQPLHIGVSQSLVNRDSTSGIKGEHFLDQINGVLVSSPEQFVEVLATVAGKLAHERAIVIIFNLVDKSGVGLANQVGNHHHLLLLSLGGQERLSSDELG